MESQHGCDCSSQTPLDLDVLTTRCLGRLDLVDRVLTKFLETLDRDLDELEEAARSADDLALSRAAHRFKGTSATIAANGLRECAERLEQSAHTGGAAKIEESLTAFKEECSRVSHAILSR